MPTVTSENLAQFNRQTMENRGQVTPITMNSLAARMNAAVDAHRALDEKARIANSKAMKAKLSGYLAKSGNMLQQNLKLQKAGNVVQLPDGRGVETTGLALAPAYEQGKFNTCPNSASCKKSCLGKTSGGYFAYGGGSDLEALKGPRLAGYKKTQALLEEPEAFAVRLHDEIEARKRAAAMNNNKLGVRLNVISDLHPKIYKSIIDAHPDVQFYDYTKNNTAPIAPNHYLTYSSTGVSQPDIGVDNPNQNWHMVRGKLDKGRNVAMPFSNKKSLPEWVHDEETGNRYRVLDGDVHDFRPIDGADTSGKGFIVGLRRKAQTMTDDNAPRNSSGFFTHFDPQHVKDAKGKLVKDQNGDAIPTNKVVIVRRQRARTMLLNNDSQPVHISQEE